VKVLDSAENADLLLEMIGEESEKRILSLSGKGVVNEFELYYRVHYRTKLAGRSYGAKYKLWKHAAISHTAMPICWAKQGEEKRLNEGMQSDVISGLMRRLSALKK